MMAQLPAKIPNMTPNCHNFPHQRIPSMGSLIPTTTTTTTQQPSQQPSWVDEFIGFSSRKRDAHRRSASNSINFLESPLVEEECRSSRASLRPTTINEFDRLDDEQLMSMFSNDISANVPPTISSSNPSTPSDHNSINDEKPTLSYQQQLKNDSGEVQSSCKPDPPVHPPTSSNGDPIVDPKRVKRILANRQSAQRSRVKKLQYISELERSVTSLQMEVSALSPRVAFLDHQRLVLNIDNSALKQRIAALAQDKIFKDAHQEALKKEVERLRQVYHQQNLKKMDNTTPNTNAPPSDTHGGADCRQGAADELRLGVGQWDLEGGVEGP